MTYLLALDQGTSSTRAILFDERLRIVAIDQQELPQIYPKPGWVEHDPEAIWCGALQTIARVLAQSGTAPAAIAAIGIANQRETAIVWERATGKPIHNAIVWQDRRTADVCERLKAQGIEPEIARKTGLRLDPYFSATKIAWILDHAADGARARAANGELLCGTVDSFLLFRLTGGRTHATDATNASRTLLCDIARAQFDPALCDIFRVPPNMLPEIRDCAGDYGLTDPALFGGAIRIGGMAGDQQAALIGQGCFRPGMSKATYGTGAFILLNTGDRPAASANGLLSTIAYQIAGKRSYALEGAIFVAGAAVKWLRDGIGIIASASETEGLARAADPNQRVLFVPALTGLGAPYWDPNARGAIFGIGPATSRREIAGAALESAAYQTRALIDAMSQSSPSVLRVDGGMAANDWMLQFLADILGVPVERPEVLETTAAGAAYLAGLSAGICAPPDADAHAVAIARRFAPAMPEDVREQRYAAWQDAVARVLTRKEP